MGRVVYVDYNFDTKNEITIKVEGGELTQEEFDKLLDKLVEILESDDKLASFITKDGKKHAYLVVPIAKLKASKSTLGGVDFGFMFPTSESSTPEGGESE